MWPVGSCTMVSYSLVERGNASLYGTDSIRSKSGLNGSFVGVVRRVGFTFASFVTQSDESVFEGSEITCRRLDATLKALGRTNAQTPLLPLILPPTRARTKVVDETKLNNIMDASGGDSNDSIGRRMYVVGYLLTYWAMTKGSKGVFDLSSSFEINGIKQHPKKGEEDLCLHWLLYLPSFSGPS